MFARRVLAQHGRRHEARTAAHVDNHASGGPPLGVLLADGSQLLFLHGGRECTRAEEHAEDVAVEEAAEFADGGFGDFGGGLHADLGRCQYAIIDYPS